MKKRIQAYRLPETMSDSNLLFSLALPRDAKPIYFCIRGNAPWLYVEYDDDTINSTVDQQFALCIDYTPSATIVRHVGSDRYTFGVVVHLYSLELL